MSALPAKGDIRWRGGKVSFVQLAAIESYRAQAPKKIASQVANKAPRMRSSGGR
jgi:hypothetical protein